MEYKEGDKLICIQTSVIHMPMYVNMSKKVVDHTDTLMSESSINDQKSKSVKMFVPVLKIENTFIDVNGKQWIKFCNGDKTPKRYQLHHLHPASKFRVATISDINPRKHG